MGFSRPRAEEALRAVSDTKEDPTFDSSEQIEKEIVQLPPVGELLSTCRKLLQMKESLAFPVHHCVSDVRGSSNVLASLFHVLSLILNKDVAARETASQSGLVKVASDILSYWISELCNRGASQVPKWVTAASVAID
ncbi:hypothetical protein POM88_030561 [Heracleum sosnowskyi]|uniref:Uncharacterized protein n=1 Tax=Heracleum sosnowskyi TaxID=360622 RepID=A0AAD8HXU8_9APIA|nr:hypothetical protein POM88_030561 [Heracleum sosnowskyi]